MATIALDATYAVERQPSGIAIYSRKLIEWLARLEVAHRFLLCYRLSRICQRREFLRPAGEAGRSGSRFAIRYIQEPFTFWLPWQAEVFHSLAQRPPAFRFRSEVVTVHDVFPLTGNDYSTVEFRKKFSALLLEAVSRATRVITPSRYTAERLMQVANVPSEKIRIIPEGVALPPRVLHPDERTQERERLVGRGNEMLLHVGVLQTRKNVVAALKALALLPSHYRLVLVGGCGYGSQAILDFVHQQRLESRILMLGYIPEQQLTSLYQAASVLVFPSLEEGFGLPVLEAMANNLPAVVANTSSLPEVGGDAVLYVHPHDVEGLAEQIRLAVEDTTLREQMVRRGRERASQFSWRRTAELTCDVYNEILAL